MKWRLHLPLNLEQGAGTLFYSKNILIKTGVTLSLKISKKPIFKITFYASPYFDGLQNKNRPYFFFLQKASTKLYLRLVIHRQTGRPQDINLATVSAYDLIQQ